MDLAGTAGVYARNALWRATGSPAAGRALVRALASEDATVRTIAAMFLARAGKQAEPLLRQRLSQRGNLALRLTTLGDLREPTLEPELRQFSRDGDPRVARAAQDALRVIAARSQ